MGDHVGFVSGGNDRHDGGPGRGRVARQWDGVVPFAAKPEPSSAEQQIGPNGEGKKGDRGRDHLRAPCERNQAIASMRPSR